MTEFDVTSEIEHAIAMAVRAQIAEENERIERDLLSIPGVTLETTHAEALELELEVIYQRHPDVGLRPEYRGIRQAGSFVIDHHPDWDLPHEEPVDENWWDDRTTPGAYSRQDSDRDMAARRAAQEKGQAA